MPPTVFFRHVSGPATRALVIGVGHYSSLPGGGGYQLKDPEGLQQLQSPPISAREFAGWLISSYQSDRRPLASVQLLISEATPAPFTYDFEGSTVEAAPQNADMATVKQAIWDWYELGNHNPDDLLLFYFCGHGVAEGALMSLLMSDFGSNPMDVMAGAVDLHRFHAGMDDCLARHQCYFIDACRSPSTLLRKYDSAGDPVLRAQSNPVLGGYARLAPKFLSTLPGNRSHSIPGKTSLFTRALIDSLNGAAAGDEDYGEWVVKTSKLHVAIQYFIREMIEENAWDVIQQPITDGMQDLPLNTLKRPEVPVSITVDPHLAHLEADLQCNGRDGFMLKRPADPSPWNFRIPVGNYRFQADFSSSKYLHTAEEYVVRPPYMLRRLKVTSS